MNKILVVDDEVSVLNAIKRSMRHTGWEFHFYSSALEALNDASVNNYDLIISDFRMPEINGLELLQSLKILRPNALRIILSGQADLELVIKAVNDAEIYRFITKPWQDDDLRLSIESALEHKKVLEENQVLADQVRAQQSQIDLQKKELERLEKQNPGLTKVNWDSDGSIILIEEDIKN